MAAHYPEPRQYVLGREIQCMQDRSQYPEVLFPNEFTPKRPGRPGRRDPGFSSDPLPVTIPIYQLSHITHSNEARKIRDQGFTFIPRPKCGKTLDSVKRAGVTYKYKRAHLYKRIPSSDQVFPGYLSWWGIDVRDWYEQEDCELLDSILEERENGRYVPGYLADPTESPYGDYAFNTTVFQILQDYTRARQGRRPYLKVGGTLRYRNEICYVVIVCTEEDKLEMPSITTGSPQFVSNGLVDENGRVVDYLKSPEFNATSIIKSEIAGPDPTGRNRYSYNYFSWEQLVFAFYFPKRGQNLVCTDVDMSDVDHDCQHYCQTY